MNTLYNIEEISQVLSETINESTRFTIKSKKKDSFIIS